MSFSPSSSSSSSLDPSSSSSVSLDPSTSSSVSIDPSFSFDPSFSTSLDPSFSSSPSSSSSSSSSSSPSSSLDPSSSSSPSPSFSYSPSVSPSSSSSSSLSASPSASSSSSPSASPELEYTYIPPPLKFGDPSYSFAPSDFSNGTSIGYSVALKKDVPFDFQFKDRFDNVISNDFDLVNSYVNVSVGFDVYTTGDVVAPSGANFRTGLVTTNYLFTKEQNSGAFGGIAQRYYKLKFNLQEESLTNYLNYTIYHMPAEITGAYVSGYSEGQTGAVTITVNTPKNGSFFTVRQFDLYTGSSSGFSPSTGNLMKNFPIYSNRISYDLNILKDEQPKGQSVYYKILPYDDFSTGYFFTGSLFGTLDYPTEPRTFLEAIPVRGSLQDRTGIFTGLATPSSTQYDGITFYQTGAGQNYYVVKSGQWVNFSSGVSSSGSGENWFIYSGSFDSGVLSLNRSGDNGIVNVNLDGRYVTGSVVRPSETGGFISVSQTGQFYPTSNPSGYIDNSSTGNLVDKISDQTISGSKNFTKIILAPSGVIGTGNSFDGVGISIIGKDNLVVGDDSYVMAGRFNNFGQGFSPSLFQDNRSFGSENIISAYSASGNAFVGNGNKLLRADESSSTQPYYHRNTLVGAYNQIVHLFDDPSNVHLENTLIGASNYAEGGSYKVLIGRANSTQGNFDRSYVFGEENQITSPESMALGFGATTSGVQTIVARAISGIFLEGPASFNERPTYNGTGFLLSGEIPTIPTRGSLQDRTGVFTGLATPTLTEYDGITFYQTGVGQDLYVVKSGQWKIVQLS